MRRRIIDPDYWSNEKAGEVGIWAWHLFAGLWSMADDAGRLRDQPSTIRATLLAHYRYPTRTLVTQWLNDLERCGSIQRYSVNGSDYIQIVNWYKYQTINRPSPSKIPPPDSVSPHGTITEPSVTTHAEVKLSEVKGSEALSNALDLRNSPIGPTPRDPDPSQATIRKTEKDRIREAANRPIPAYRRELENLQREIVDAQDDP